MKTALVIVTMMALSLGMSGQTTLFGITLGQPYPEGDFDQGLGAQAHWLYGSGIDTDELDGNVERIQAQWVPEMCERVEVALKDKFHSPTSVSSWRGRNGLGLPISGKVWRWRRRNGDVIQWTRPSPEWWPDCQVHAWTAKFAAQPKEKDHL
jgi:hypothetical protein